jgi:hypothetical protein
LNATENARGIALYAHHEANGGHTTYLHSVTIGPHSAVSPEIEGVMAYLNDGTNVNRLRFRQTIVSTPGAAVQGCWSLNQDVGDVSGESEGYNVVPDASCQASAAPGDTLDTTPDLLPLAKNDGATQTHALGAGSSAHNLVTGGCLDRDGSPLLVDQRDRPRGTPCDAGAYEEP